MPDKILFVINKTSGENNNDWQAGIEAYFKGKDVVLEFYHLPDPVDCNSLDQYIKDAKADKVVAVGGDGTISLVAKSVRGTPMILGVIPAGSANGMAKELMIPTKLEDALQIIDSGRQTYMDTILLNDKHLCLHLSDVGINAQLIKNFEEGDTRGKIGYLKVAWKTIIRRQALEVTIKNDDKSFCRKAIMVVIANAGKYGTGAVINPEGEIDDGLFEIVIVKRLTLWGFLKIMLSLGFDNKNMEIHQTRSVNILAKHRAHFQVDGEYIGKVDKIAAIIQPKNIRIMLPQA
ncbi:diacylglycerol/lipid kinase family protein [Niabella sp. CJ426]|uniref:diacylglycerol/lipid kinase family protein n=1 Tax=Niabella sp. CJ426 TaxID=3393740 RepID=UPI003D00377E